MKKNQFQFIIILNFSLLITEVYSECPCLKIDTIGFTGKLLNKIEKAEKYDNCRQRIGVFVNPENIRQYEYLKNRNIDSLSLEDYKLLCYYRANIFKFQKEANYNANICSDSLLNLTLVSPRLKDYIELLKDECNEMQRDLKRNDTVATLNHWNNYSEDLKKPIYISKIRNNGNRYLRSSLIVLSGGIISGVCEYLLIKSFNTNLWNEGNYSLAVIGALCFGAVAVISIPASISLLAIGKTKNDKVINHNELINRLQNGEKQNY